MPFVRGSAIEKTKRGSLEHRIDTVHGLIQAEYGENPINVVATFEDHVIAFNSDGKLRKIAYSINESGDLEIGSDKASRSIPIIEDEDIPSHVAKELKSISEKLAKGNMTQGMRTQVRELAPFISKDEMYWMSDIVDKLDESVDDNAEWYRMYEANVERIRTALHGRVREIEGRVPKAHYSRISKARLGEFKKEMSESMGIVGDLFSGFITAAQGLSFEDKQEFLGAVRESLIAESQAVVGLLGKAEKLTGRESDMPLMAKAHDKLADRAKAMAIVLEYICMKARPDDKE